MDYLNAKIVWTSEEKIEANQVRMGLRDYFLAQFRRYEKAEIATRAAALAYHSILAIVPIVGLVFWYLTKVGITSRYLDLTKEFIISQLNVDSEGRFEKYFEKLTSSVGGHAWGWIGLGVLLYTAFNLMIQFGFSLDVILGTYHPDSSQSLERKRIDFELYFRRFVVMLGLPIALAISLAITHWIRNDSWLRYLVHFKQVGPKVLGVLVALLVDVAVFFLMYYSVPKFRPPWKQALKAACIVGPILEIMRWVFAFYNSYSVSVHRIYGVLAIIPLFILWVQISWVILLIGALFIEVPNESIEGGSQGELSGEKV